jgi:hypothetical protein
MEVDRKTGVEPLLEHVRTAQLEHAAGGQAAAQHPDDRRLAYRPNPPTAYVFRA